MRLLITKPLTESTNNEKLKVLWRCILFTVLIKFIGSLLITVSKFSHFNGLTDLLKTEINLTDSFSTGISLLLVIIILPAVEEIAFRGWLTDSSNTIVISLTFFFYYLLNILIKTIPILSQIERPIKIELIIILLIIIFTLLIRNRKIISDQIRKHQSILLFISILSFTMIHALNYNIQTVNIETLLGLLVILLPFPFHAYLLTYIRIKNGLQWSFTLHVFNNSLILFPVIFAGWKI